MKLKSVWGVGSDGGEIEADAIADADSGRCCNLLTFIGPIKHQPAPCAPHFHPERDRI